MYISRKILIALVLVVLVGATAAYWFVTSHGFSAREKPTWYEAWLVRQRPTACGRATRLHAGLTNVSQGK